MPVETLTYAALGARLTTSPNAARSLVKRLRLPRSLSDDGKAMVSVDLTEIRHKRRPPREAGNVALAAKIIALQGRSRDSKQQQRVTGPISSVSAPIG